MKLIDQLKAVTLAYSEATGTKLSTLGSRLLKGGKRFHQIIEEGSDVSTSNFEMCMAWFSENWPEEAEWPPGVARPAVPPPGPALQATG